MSILNELLMDVASERRRQDEIFGDQIATPDVTEPGDGSSWLDEQHARDLCERAAQPSWAHIATEELAEVIGAQDDEHRITELVQLAAVCLSWAECIKRRRTS